MLSIQEHATVEDASANLLDYVLDPNNWVEKPVVDEDVTESAAGRGLSFQRRVGKLRISACVDVNAKLETILRVAFRAPGLSPMRAADHLESFLKPRLPMVPNSEWQVEMDDRSWIHFTRRYTGPSLRG